MPDDIIHITENDLESPENSSVIHISEQELKSELVLGTKLEIAQETNDNKSEEKICPFDQQILEKDQDLVVCTSCGTPHHAQCWEYNKGCAVFNCGGKTSMPYSITPESQEIQDIDLEQTSNPTTVKSNRHSDQTETLIQFLRKILGS